MILGVKAPNGGSQPDVGFEEVRGVEPVVETQLGPIESGPEVYPPAARAPARVPAPAA